MKMKATPKILASAVALVMALGMSVGTTFAWFSMNTKVTVSGMQVQATAKTNLLISKDGETKTFLPSVNISSETGAQLSAMVPTSTAGGATPTFYKVKAVGTKMAADNYAAGYDTTFEQASAGSDYLKQTVWIKLTGTDNGANLVATINTPQGGNSLLDKSLRVMLVNGSNFYIYAPIAGYDTTVTGIQSITAAETPTAVAANKGADADGKAIEGITYYEELACENETQSVVAGETVVTGKYFKLPAGTIDQTSQHTYQTNGSAVVLQTVTANTEYKFDIYIWFEGEDENCKATNAVDLTSTQFSIDFALGE